MGKLFVAVAVSVAVERIVTGISVVTVPVELCTIVKLTRCCQPTNNVSLIRNQSILTLTLLNYKGLIVPQTANCQ